MALNEIARAPELGLLLAFLAAASHEHHEKLWLDPFLVPRAFVYIQIDICKRRRRLQQAEPFMKPVPAAAFTDRILDGVDLDALARAVDELGPDARLDEATLIDGKRFAELQHQRGPKAEIERAMILGRGQRVGVGAKQGPMGKVLSLAAFAGASKTR